MVKKFKINVTKNKKDILSVRIDDLVERIARIEEHLGLNKQSKVKKKQEIEFDFPEIPGSNNIF